MTLNLFIESPAQKLQMIDDFVAELWDYLTNAVKRDPSCIITINKQPLYDDTGFPSPVYGIEAQYVGERYAIEIKGRW